MDCLKQRISKKKKNQAIERLNLLLWLLPVFYLVLDAQLVSGQQAPVLLAPDYQQLVSRADLVYNRPASRSEAGQPIGNGRMGSLIWTTPSQIRMQINRVDIFGNNSSSDNFYERNTDYCGGAGFVDLDFGQPVFDSSHFKQQLSCYDAVSTVHAGQ